jgi:hypothetical protein
VLHDFCMVIPYGIALVLFGMIALATAGAAKFGWFATLAGVGEIGLSSLSLGTWKKGENNTPWTLLCLGLSSCLAYVAVQLYRLEAFMFVSGTIGGMSVAMSAFLAYNLLAGGNRPRTEAKERRT